MTYPEPKPIYQTDWSHLLKDNAVAMVMAVHKHYNDKSASVAQLADELPAKEVRVILSEFDDERKRLNKMLVAIETAKEELRAAVLGNG